VRGLERMLIALVHTRPSPPWTIRQLILAFESLGVSTRYVRPEQISLMIERGGGIKVFLGSPSTQFEFDAIILRDLGFATTIETFLRRVDLFEIINMSGTPVINPARALVTARDKLLSLAILAKHGIPVPQTASVEDPNVAMRIAQEWKDVVIKPLIGSMGFGSTRARDPDVVYVISRTLTELGQPTYIQRYVEKPNRDIRAFVVGDRLVAAYYRVSSQGWKTNIAQGARAQPMTRIDPELEELAVRATKVLGLHYSGVDIAESPDGYIVLEVNASPNWRGLSIATGINPATHIARYVYELVKK